MAKKLMFSEYSDLVQEKFSDAKDFHTFGKICIDTYKNKLQKYSIEEANTVIRNKIREIAGLPENPTDRQIKKAFKKTAVREAIFEILEETCFDRMESVAKNAILNLYDDKIALAICKESEYVQSFIQYLDSLNTK